MEFANRWDPHLWHVDEAGGRGVVLRRHRRERRAHVRGLHQPADHEFPARRGRDGGKDINLQLRAPVRPDEEIHARVTVAALEDVPHRDGQGLVSPCR